MLQTGVAHEAETEVNNIHTPIRAEDRVHDKAGLAPKDSSSMKRLVKSEGFNELRPFATFVDLGATFGLVAICVVGVLLTPYFLIVNAILVPLLVVRLWALGHEASHGLLSRQRLVNDLIGLIAQGMILVPFYGWRAGHLSHHLNNDHPVKEEYLPASVFKLFQRTPENADQAEQQPPTLAKATLKLFRIGVVNFFYDIGLWRSYSSPKGLLRRKFRDRTVQMANVAFPVFFWLLYLVLTVFYPLYAIAGIWLPILVGHGLIGVVGFLNHQDMDDRIEFHFKSTRDIAASQTIDVDYGPLNWFTMGIGDEHTMHHLMPSIPWYNLHRARMTAEAKGRAVDRHTSSAKAWSAMAAFLLSEYRVLRSARGYRIDRKLHKGDGTRKAEA